jgi:hypothetical protein
MKKALLIVSLLIPLSGCTLLGGASDYDSHVRGRVEFKQSDDTRMAAQSQAIADLAAKDSANAEAAAYKNALAMVAIGMLRNQEYGEKAPMSITEGVVEVVKGVAPYGAITYTTVTLGREIARAAGAVSIGDNATISGSFNKPTANSFGDGMATAAPGVEVVKPEIVQPVVIP